MLVIADNDMGQSFQHPQSQKAVMHLGRRLILLRLLYQNRSLLRSLRWLCSGRIRPSVKLGWTASSTSGRPRPRASARRRRAAARGEAELIVGEHHPKSARLAVKHCVACGDLVRERLDLLA